MAIQRLAHIGYGVIERNRVNAENMESACELDAAKFPDGAEVGRIVGVRKDLGKVVLSTDPLATKGVLNNSEKVYDQFHQGLNQYKVKGGKMAAVLYLEQGNTFTTNTICYDTTEFANDEAVKTAFKNLETAPLACIPSTVAGYEHWLGMNKWNAIMKVFFRLLRKLLALLSLLLNIRLCQICSITALRS